MANIIGYVTAALLAVSAFLAFKNKGALAEFSKETQTGSGEYEEKSQMFEEKKTMVSDYSSQAEEAKEGLESLKADIKKLEDSLGGLDEKIEQAQENEAAKEQEVASADKALEQMDEVEFLLKDLKQQQRELAESQDRVATLEAKLAAATASVKATEKKVDDLRNVASGKTTASLTTSIRSTISGWGFVILNGGDSAGVTAGSTLNVVRSGKTIAKLLVKTVESNSASADIIPGTLKRGYHLHAGDRVVNSDA